MYQDETKKVEFIAAGMDLSDHPLVLQGLSYLTGVILENNPEVIFQTMHMFAELCLKGMERIEKADTADAKFVLEKAEELLKPFKDKPINDAS